MCSRFGENGTLDIIISRQALLCLSQHQEHVSISRLSASSFPTFLCFHSTKSSKSHSPKTPSKFLPLCFCTEMPFCPHFTVPGAATLHVQAQALPLRWSTAAWAPCHPCKNQSSLRVGTSSDSCLCLLLLAHLAQAQFIFVGESLAVNRSEVDSHRWTHTLAIFLAGDHR